VQAIASQAAGGRGRKRDQDDLGPFAAHAQDPVAVFFAEVRRCGRTRLWRLRRRT
jgi:hypothetical protein